MKSAGLPSPSTRQEPSNTGRESSNERRRSPTSRRGPATPQLRDSRQRILDAAAAEFALRGFEGTTVDRIAARARLNKAMIYYHFHSKRALYTCVLRDVFTLMGDRLSALASTDADPPDKMDRFVSTFVLEGQTLAHIAPIMLREIAGGGRRLDEETYSVMIRVVRSMTGIVEQGRQTGQFADVDPFMLYLTTIWPIVVYLATTPIRSAVARVAHLDPARLDPDRFIQHMQMLNRRALMPAAGREPSGEPS
jgi:AcrR family transcriptional regulator